jgi:hypothetical protein
VNNQLFVFNFINPFIFIKLGFMILIFFYIVFSAVILRRVNIMNKCISQPALSFLLVFISFINIILAILLFFLAIVIL